MTLGDILQMAGVNLGAPSAAGMLQGMGVPVQPTPQVGGLQSQVAGQAVPGSDRVAYLNYVQTATEMGTKPLPYPQWVKAGKPEK